MIREPDEKSKNRTEKMVDENRNKNTQERKNGPKKTRERKISATDYDQQKATTTMTGKRRRRRRSLFSVLFSQSRGSLSHQANSSDESHNEKEDSLDRQQRTKQHNRDIVLIKPTEAKCVEATVVSLVESDDEPAHGRRSKSVTSESTKGFFRRRMFKKKKRSRDEDADSYVLDLRDCLNREKLRCSSSSSSSSSSSLNSLTSSASSSLSPKSFTKPKEIRQNSRQQPQVRPEREKSSTTECSPLRETSPIDDLWQTNKEYIPALETNNNSKPVVGLKAKKQTRSPMLVEFLQSHRISRSPSSMESSSSSCDSLTCSRVHQHQRVPLQLPSYNQNSLTVDATHTLDAAKLSSMSESERRLYHWRRMAARSVCMWQVPENSSSDEDSDLGDLLDCSSSAKVCYCSDDTSCSSVELIWSRQTDSPPLAPIGRPLTRLTSLLRTSISSDLNRISPASSRSSRSPLQSQQLQHPQVDRPPLKRQQNSYNQKNASTRSICQKPSILELAKPSRARDRLVCRNDDEVERYRRIRRQRMSNVARRSMPIVEVEHFLLGESQPELIEPATPPPPSAVAVSKTREWSAMPVSRSASGSGWHPNPLFGHLSGGFKPIPTSELEACDDHQQPTLAEVNKMPKVPLRRHSSVAANLHSQHQKSTSETKSRFRSFLARIKSRQDKQDGDGMDEFDPSPESSLASTFKGARGRRHRWSLRMNGPDGGAYLNQLANLDRRIKSNVSSFLSDTGKRASVLADQLLTTIKDTTGTAVRDRYDTLPNSRGDPLLVQKQPLQGNQADGCNTNNRKAQLFSLIYMHQQHTASGRPVITRQPTSAMCDVASRAPVLSHTISENEATTTMTSETGAREELLANLDTLLDPKELLMDEFRRLQSESSKASEDFQRRARTMGMKKDDSTQASGQPTRRSSCTV